MRSCTVHPPIDSDRSFRRACRPHSIYPLVSTYAVPSLPSSNARLINVEIDPRCSSPGSFRYTASASTSVYILKRSDSDKANTSFLDSLSFPLACSRKNHSVVAAISPSTNIISSKPETISCNERRPQWSRSQ